VRQEQLTEADIADAWARHGRAFMATHGRRTCRTDRCRGRTNGLERRDMPTKRVPRRRPPKRPISPRAVELFAQMEAPGLSSEKWWSLHSQLHDELRCRPWEFPCIEDLATGNPEPAGTYNHQRWRPDEAARRRYCELEAAAVKAGLIEPRDDGEHGHEA
jgi:hypothetical protein